MTYAHGSLYSISYFLYLAFLKQKKISGLSLKLPHYFIKEFRCLTHLYNFTWQDVLIFLTLIPEEQERIWMNFLAHTHVDKFHHNDGSLPIGVITVPH